MITYVPLPTSYRACVSILDHRKLGKQRVDALQIFTACTHPTNAWHSHPAVKMWRGAELGLLAFGIAACDEWIARGHVDTLRDNFITNGIRISDNSSLSTDYYPSWWGDDRVHSSHRALLLSLDSAYGRFNWTERPSRNIYWPDNTLPPTPARPQR